MLEDVGGAGSDVLCAVVAGRCGGVDGYGQATRGGW